MNEIPEIVKKAKQALLMSFMYQVNCELTAEQSKALLTYMEAMEKQGAPEKSGVLTVEVLAKLEPDTIFAHGMAKDDEAGLNMMGTGLWLRWVAVRGYIHDWAIYCALEGSNEYIRDYGDKVMDIDAVRRVIDVDDDALACYRRH